MKTFRDFPVRPMSMDITDKLKAAITKALVKGMVVRSITFDEGLGMRTLTADIDILAGLGEVVGVEGRITISNFHVFSPGTDKDEMPTLCMPGELGSDPA